LRNRATLLLAASGVGCNDFGGRTGICFRSSRASLAINASCAFSAIFLFVSLGSLMLVFLFPIRFAQRARAQVNTGVCQRRESGIILRGIGKILTVASAKTRPRTGRCPI
jgi:hypothetical protein